MQLKAMINMRQFHGPSMPTLSVHCFVAFENQHQVRDSPAVFYARRDPNVKSYPPKTLPLLEDLQLPLVICQGFLEDLTTSVFYGHTVQNVGSFSAKNSFCSRIACPLQDFLAYLL